MDKTYVIEENTVSTDEEEISFDDLTFDE